MNKIDSSQIISDKFDYTKWQREYFDDKAPEEISEEACQFEKTRPARGCITRL